MCVYVRVLIIFHNFIHRYSLLSVLSAADHVVTFPFTSLPFIFCQMSQLFSNIRVRHFRDCCSRYWWRLIVIWKYIFIVRDEFNYTTLENIVLIIYFRCRYLIILSWYVTFTRFDVVWSFFYKVYKNTAFISL